MVDEAEHMAEDMSLNEATTRKPSKMDTTMLDCFSQLNKVQVNVRINAGITLMRHFSRHNEDTENKEKDHALRRLVRGVGASQVAARKGYFSTLTAFLTLNPDTPVEKVLEFVKKELTTAGSNSDGENADIYMGQILVSGALIHSKILENSSTEDQIKVIELMVSAGKQRSYLTFISVSFLVDLIQALGDKHFTKKIWPTLKPHFSIDWSKQTLDTLYILLLLRKKYPKIINKAYLTQVLGTEEFICEETMDHLVRVLTDLPRIICYRHPIYKLFVEELLATDHAITFWLKIDERFAKPSKTDERVALEILKTLIQSTENKDIVPSLITPKFLQYMLKRFISCKKKRIDEISIEFRNILLSMVNNGGDKDSQTDNQIAILKKLILYPGDLMIEKTTGTKIIQLISTSLNAAGVKELTNIYKDVILGTRNKEGHHASNNFWTNAERTYTTQLLTKLMSHPEVINDKEWRLEQLKFLFSLGLCESPNVGVELAPQFKDCFYHALDQKLPKLSDVRSVLSSLIHHLNEELFENETLKLRKPLSEEAVESWNQMISLVKKLESTKKHKDAVAMFHTMNLHMGLQLFTDTEMAVASIKDLHSCYDRLKKSSTKRSSSVESVDESEPQWVEVVVDLLLSLLSRNSHLMRSLVQCVFPHVCPFLTATSVHQILAVLDPKNDKSPLTSKADSDDDSSDESGEEGEPEPVVDEQSEKDESEGNESESDSESEGGSGDEDETMTDRLRMAVRQALGSAASAQTDDEDMDVDQIDEEEGKRLNRSLGAAFKMLKLNRPDKSKRQEKSAQALTHFRVRVIDLLETYLESLPSMALALDMLVPLFTLLEFCIKDRHQKPLENRIRSCLKKYSNIKKFKSTEGVDNELLTVILKVLIEKGERSASVCQEMGDKLTECCTFLIRCQQQAGLPSDDLLSIYREHLTAFFKKRDCVLPATLFKSILQLCWDGNWKLAPMLITFAFDNTVRPFRRGQALEFLTVFYHNVRMTRQDTEHSKEKAKLESELAKKSVLLLNELSTGRKKDNGEMSGKEVKQKFVCRLFVLLHAVHSQHVPQAWDWKSVADAMTLYRSKSSALARDAKSAYNKLAVVIGAPVNVKPASNETTQNGQASTDKTEADGSIASEEEEGSTAKKSKKELKKMRKNKSKQKDKQKLKKEARELRAKAMGEGLESINFSSVPLGNQLEEEETLTNGIAENGVSKSKVHKRSKDSSDCHVKAKKKKVKKNSSGD